MARQATIAGEAKPSVVTRIQGFYHEVMAEMAKVTWPTKEELKSSTQVVLGLLVLAALITLLYDQVFTKVILGLFNLID